MFPQRIRLVLPHFHDLVADTELRSRDGMAHTSRNTCLGQQVLPSFLTTHFLEGNLLFRHFNGGIVAQSNLQALSRFKIRVSLVPCARAWLPAKTMAISNSHFLSSKNLCIFINY